ncbi:type II toxin-antitoxin system RelE/ParE family toxin [Leptospira sp. 2 VSF19]|uniref:Type II toxin-antitoxin system RelE/ParE family toxin n=1 Tax=Leptospira soteropolitanensis TaxID=2950025 RepID=A0AAW5VL32_9LEPT|nr:MULTISPECIES: type II toxin-antitoxin system RelE/ParE family toxin [Leptospira]MCW7494865.1 type II toxin-antitoxin system RelE/ParE family toxin [Leptospira soteropolitanensis]MCW7502285.1 type II toxin-antitoxin system RelE/ParE family toxin [Leptospira soteropolitanensis]MCW7524686.1 type II toxin-antitoxin system RelE/ParE family toxin [Leptospira soteropolitanensis]MCW7528556.1 type II toxin-antitoxin system RelE/ParE family toxin [Leptospira soteropolitanensis]MCW7532236.1 type II to
MILSFGDKETEKIFNQIFSKRIPPEIQRKALTKLILIDNAEKEDDLKSPPSNRLESLKGDLNGFYSIRINDQWRIIFTFEQGNCYQVSIIDYH